MDILERATRIGLAITSGKDLKAAGVPDDATSRQLWADIGDSVSKLPDGAQADIPSGGLPFEPRTSSWSGWRYDRQLAAHYAAEFRRALHDAVDAEGLARDYLKSNQVSKGVLSNLAQQVLSWLTGKGIQQAVQNAIQQVLSNLYAEGFAVGKESALEQLGSGYDSSFWDNWVPGDTAAARLVAGPGLQDLLDQYGIQTIKSVSQTRLNDLANALAEGFEDGDSPDQIARDIRQVLIKPQRALMIAGTELARATTMASVTEYRKAGQDAKEWSTAHDDRVCKEHCKPNSKAGLVPMDQPFPDTGDMFPPAHPECRCALLPGELPASVSGKPDLHLVKDHPHYTREQVNLRPATSRSRSCVTCAMWTATPHEDDPPAGKCDFGFFSDADDTCDKWTAKPANKVGPHGYSHGWIRAEPGLVSPVMQHDQSRKNEIQDRHVNRHYRSGGTSEVLHTPSAMTAPEDVPAGQVVSLMGTVDGDTVNRYLDRLASGDDIGTSLGVRDGDKVYLVDGNHRADARVRAGQTTLPVRFVVPPAQSANKSSDVKAGGLAVWAKDTGRVLMIQRAHNEDDPAGGMWEFPGGRLDPGETAEEAARREFTEETGLDAPAGAPVATWETGPYTGHVVQVDRESDLPILDRAKGTNPDDPDNEEPEAIAWWDPSELKDNPAVRDELRDHPKRVRRALEATGDDVGKGVLAGMATSLNVDPQTVFDQLSKNYPPESIAWVKRATWHGPYLVSWDKIDHDDMDKWAASHQPERVDHFAKKIEAGEDVSPVVLVADPDGNFIDVDGHHRALAYRKLGRPVRAWMGQIRPEDRHAMEETHLDQEHEGADPENE